MQLCDILIHISEKLSQEAKTQLENHLRDEKGVIAPRFNGQQHLLLVCYNRELTQAAQLLNTVKAQGYTAQLVGL